MSLPSNDPLKQTRLFADLNLEERALIRARGTASNYSDGAPILDLGGENDRLFVILEGAVNVERPGLERSTAVATLEAGAFFGEVSFINATKASAVVRARGATTVFSITKGDLEALLAERPHLAARMYRNLARELATRLIHTGQLLDHYADLADVLRVNPEAHEVLGYS